MPRARSVPAGTPGAWSIGSRDRAGSLGLRAPSRAAGYLPHNAPPKTRGGAPATRAAVTYSRVFSFITEARVSRTK